MFMITQAKLFILSLSNYRKVVQQNMAIVS